jgi:hypothetical protein
MAHVGMGLADQIALLLKHVLNRSSVELGFITYTFDLANLNYCESMILESDYCYEIEISYISC